MRKPKRKRRRRIATHELMHLCEQAIADCRLDIIGWDSCVMVVKLIHQRLLNRGIPSAPLAVCAYVEYGDMRVDLVKPPDDPGHAILLCQDFLIDATINMAHEMAREAGYDFPELEPSLLAFTGSIPADAWMSYEQNGCRIHYRCRDDHSFVTDSYDWQNDRMEQFVDTLKHIPDDELKAWHDRFVAEEKGRIGD